MSGCVGIGFDYMHYIGFSWTKVDHINKRSCSTNMTLLEPMSWLTCDFFLLKSKLDFGRFGNNQKWSRGGNTIKYASQGHFPFMEKYIKCMFGYIG